MVCDTSLDNELEEEPEATVTSRAEELTVPNKIIEIPLRIEEGPGMYPGEVEIIDTELLGTISEILSQQGSDMLSAYIDIERRHAATARTHDGHEDGTHVLRFTASKLTDVAILLSIAVTEALEAGQIDIADEIRMFGQLIQAHTNAPMDVTKDVSLDGMEPIGDDSEIRPFDVIAGEQRCTFTET